MTDYIDDSIACKNNNSAFSWKRAQLPTIFSGCAFVCFIIVYLLLTVNVIDTIYYLLGLIFILPCLALALIAYLAGKGKLGGSGTVILTAVLVPFFMITSFFCLFILGISQTSALVTNVSRYERTMRLGGYSEKEQLAIFPEKIPADATNAAFYYSEGSWQEYSQTVVLQFSAPKEKIDGYVSEFITSAVQIDNTDIKSLFDSVRNCYTNNLPADYRMYVIINEGSHNRKVGAVFISQEKNDIIFYAYEMRW